MFDQLDFTPPQGIIQSNSGGTGSTSERKGREVLADSAGDLVTKPFAHFRRPIESSMGEVL
jgi:hypothetical protein